MNCSYNSDLILSFWVKKGGKKKITQGSAVYHFPDKIQVLSPFVIQVGKTPCIGLKSKYMMEDMDQVTFLCDFTS